MKTNKATLRVYDERIAQESTYPSVLPSVGDTPFEILDQVYQVARDGEISIDHTVAEVLHAPPGYVSCCGMRPDADVNRQTMLSRSQE